MIYIYIFIYGLTWTFTCWESDWGSVLILHIHLTILDQLPFATKTENQIFPLYPVPQQIDSIHNVIEACPPLPSQSQLLAIQPLRDHFVCLLHTTENQTYLYLAQVRWHYYLFLISLLDITVVSFLKNVTVPPKILIFVSLSPSIQHVCPFSYHTFKGQLEHNLHAG